MLAFFKKDSFYQNEHELNLIPFILALVTGNQGTDHPLSLPSGEDSLFCNSNLLHKRNHKQERE